MSRTTEEDNSIENKTTETEEDSLIEKKTTEAEANPGQGKKSNAIIVVRRDTTKVNIDS